MLRTIMNIIWLVLSGIWLALGYAVAGIVMFILIITIPFGVQAFLARRLLAPARRRSSFPPRTGQSGEPSAPCGNG
jgi:Inner membrane component domain